MTPDETTSEEKSSRSYWGFVLWPLAILLLYPLSEGPARLGVRKGIVNWEVLKIYNPLERAVVEMGIKKPFRWYLHMWDPGMQ